MSKLTDKERLDWYQQHPDQLEHIADLWWLRSDGNRNWTTIRPAIDAAIAAEKAGTKGRGKA